MASLNSPIPRRVSGGKLRGESTGSRQSSNGSRRPQSHSKVEAFILKNSLNESGLHANTEPSRGPGSLSSSGSARPEKWARLRFLENDRRDTTAAISAVARNWRTRGNRDCWKSERGDEKELGVVSVRGFEGGKRRKMRMRI